MKIWGYFNESCQNYWHVKWYQLFGDTLYIYKGHFKSKNYFPENYNRYPNYGLNSTTIGLWEGWLWHYITYTGWYVIKQKKPNLQQIQQCFFASNELKSVCHAQKNLFQQRQPTFVQKWCYCQENVVHVIHLSLAQSAWVIWSKPLFFLWVDRYIKHGSLLTSFLPPLKCLTHCRTVLTLTVWFLLTFIKHRWMSTCAIFLLRWIQWYTSAFLSNNISLNCHSAAICNKVQKIMDY